MVAKHLTSDHLNYLIWRYLQEAGYGDAAAKLQKHWNRNPESLPFAQHISRHALVSVVQDGLFLDELQAKTTNRPRRHLFVSVDSTSPQSPRRATSTSPDRSAANGRKRPSISVNDDSANHVQPRPAKRRKSRGVEPHVNGDAMDVDANGYVNGNRDPTPSERGSAVPPSPIRWRPATLEHGTSTGVQTENQPFNDFAETTYVEIEDSVAIIAHTDWSPDDPNLFFTAGESICKLWSIPKVSTAADTPTSIDLSADLGGDPSEPYMVTATCWGPDGELFLAVETASHGEARRVVLKVDTNAAATMVLATTSGTTIDIQCHPSGLCLLGHSVTQHGSRSLEIWPLAESGHPFQPSSRYETDLDIRDIAWVSDNEFIVCGHNFINRFAWSAEHGIEETTQQYDKGKYDHDIANYPWDIATSDTGHGAAAFASIYEGRLGVVRNDSHIETAAVPDCQITAVRFKPTSAHSSSPILAASYTDGNVRLWSFTKPHPNDADISMNGDGAPERLLRCVRILPVGLDILPTALAFSPDGSFIAAASEHRVHIWAIDRGWPPKAVWTAAKERWKGSDGDENAVEYAGLSWDAEGRRLALALHKQMAIITFQRRFD